MVAKRKAAPSITAPTSAVTPATPTALPLDSVICGDALAVLRGLPDNSIDAIVTDPPAGISFMGRAWDSDKGGRDAWIAWLAEVMAEALRVVKPGGHALVWALPRTSHWTATALEDAGWEVRDRVAHITGQGFPKSLDISKQLDKAARRDYVLAAQRLGLRIPGNSLHDWTKAEHSPGDAWWKKFKAVISADDWQRIEREVTGQGKSGAAVIAFARDEASTYTITAPATDAARQWDGYGTALKPAVEDWWLCRKPLSESSIAANVLRWGTGGLNIAACRVELTGIAQHRTPGKGAIFANFRGDTAPEKHVRNYTGPMRYDAAGRWPANLLLSHSLWDTPEGCADDCPVAALDAQSGVSRSVGGRKGRQFRSANAIYGHSAGGSDYEPGDPGYGDTGGASRYFQTFRYVSKASRRERNAGCEALPVARKGSNYGMDGARPHTKPDYHYEASVQNTHPCVKPLALMSWLAALITPPGGVILDPFAGSGSTLCAAKAGGWRYIGVEREAEYVAIAESRLAAVKVQQP